jgi:hypothetical protein
MKKKAGSNEVRLRMIRDDDVPASHDLVEEYVFGLQDKNQQIFPGQRRADGKLIFDFTLQVKPGADPKHPVFTGPFASGPADDRFVYLSWRSVPRGVYINRVKARLSAIKWTMVRAAQAADKPLVANMTGWVPGDKRKQVEWRIDISDQP